jgi:hypothetical protein
MNTAVLSCLLAVSTAFAFDFKPRIINGQEVPAGQYKEVVALGPAGSDCTATIIGPRVILTSAHCVDEGSKVDFMANGSKYTATMYRSTIYPGKDHDIAVGVTSAEITGVTPASIGGVASKGLGVYLFGYGCTTPEGNRPNVLRYGENEVIDFTNGGMDMVSRKPNGAAICFGDSGGPTMVKDDQKHLVIGVNSKGNIQDTNMSTRTDINETKTFLQSIASSKSVEICGVNKNCAGGPITPAAPKCSLSAFPSTITLGQSLKLTLSVSGQATSVTLEGVPFSLAGGEKTVTPSAAGSFNASASVTGPGGTSTCNASYTVNTVISPDPAPSCQLTATSPAIKVGESNSISMVVAGKSTSATIDGISVPATGGSVTISSNLYPGTKTINGTVTGPGGTGTCKTSYSVQGEPPAIPNFTIAPTHCGENVSGSAVQEVCFGLVKFAYSMRDEITVREVLIFRFSGKTEIMPIIYRRPGRARDEKTLGETLTMYANDISLSGGNIGLATRKAELQRLEDGTPVTLSGFSAGKVQHWYQIDKFRKL